MKRRKRRPLTDEQLAAIERTHALLDQIAREQRAREQRQREKFQRARAGAWKEVG